jgi:hypothetical protein
MDEMAASKTRGRDKGFKMPDDHRTKIQNSKILNDLIACAEGRLEMSQTRASVALGLMRKVLPDLSSVESKNETTVRYVARVPDKAANSTVWQQQHAPALVKH